MAKYTIKEFLELLYLNWKVKFYNFVEFGKVVWYYYPKSTFRRCDFRLITYYLFNNPFQIAKHFLYHRGEDPYTYGETPLTTLDTISRLCRLTPGDLVFELGCGRGRTCFWLNQFVGCRVVGVDFVPEFIQKADSLKEAYDLDDIEFRCEDMLQTGLSGATVIYLYGICYSDGFIRQLIKRFESLPAGCKIITVSYELAEYDPRAPFERIRRFSVPFTWGVADVYLQIKI